MLTHQVTWIAPEDLSFRMIVSSTDFPPFKPENLSFTQSQVKPPKPTNICYGCRETDCLCRRCPKMKEAETDAESIFSFNYACSKDELSANRKVYYLYDYVFLFS